MSDRMAIADETARHLLRAMYDAAIVASQPSHEFDRQVAQNAAEGFIDVLADPKEGEEIYVSVVGSLSWSGDPAPNVFSNASVSVHASVRTKAA